MFITQFFIRLQVIRRTSGVNLLCTFISLCLQIFPMYGLQQGDATHSFRVITYFLDVVLPIARLRSRRITEGFVAVSTPLSLLWR